MKLYNDDDPVESILTYRRGQLVLQRIEADDKVFFEHRITVAGRLGVLKIETEDVDQAFRVAPKLIEDAIQKIRHAPLMPGVMQQPPVVITATPKLVDAGL